ncbi:AAA family ATPase [Paraburkholderia sp. J10-1]|uniref:AAA family ATPase n=1 Tax=Paraburkholderia sp. J10-1 TaxID=2805430 RepID=UPI002AB7DEEB|nr:AAA family ATPase [Paraburkholderia sp. J10-1]
MKLEGEVDSMMVEGLVGFVTSGGASKLSDARYIDTRIRNEQSDVIAPKKTDAFFTMLPTLADYRGLVGVLGVEVVQGLLLALNDVVALGEWHPGEELLKQATATEVFQRSFIRTSEAFFAFKNAGSILRGPESEIFGKMSPDFRVMFRLGGAKNDHNLVFSFDHQSELPKRIAVVIGRNGVGKSQALVHIARAAITGDEDTLSEATTSRRVSINRLLAFAPTYEAFPPDKRKASSVWYKRFALNRVERFGRGGAIADLILQLARHEGNIGTYSRWTIFINAIQIIRNWEEIALPQTKMEAPPRELYLLRGIPDTSKANDVNADTPPKHVNDELLDVFSSIDLNSEPVRVVDGEAYPLSSGEISLLRFAARASLYIENGSLLLLDEPETHLHPNFIKQFIVVLDNMLKLTGSAAVIATHSVYCVREVFSEQVTVLDVIDGVVRTEPLRLQTFGADIGAISYFVFGEDEPSPLASDVEERLLKRYQDWEKLYSDYGDELSPKLLGKLRLELESGKK